MFPQPILLVAASALVCMPTLVPAKGFHVERRGSLRAKPDAKEFQREIQLAVGEALGCGGHIDDERLVAIEEMLVPTWRSLPKNEAGRIDRRSLRYLAHRYFSRKSALVVRGFEPSRSAGAAGWGAVDILSQRVPAYVESVLESKHAAEHGFDLRDAAHIVATLEQLIFDSESTLLEKVYAGQHKATERSLSDAGLTQVLEDYLVHWMMGSDTEAINALLSNRTLLETAFPHWDALAQFARGEVKALEFRRQHTPLTSGRVGHNALSARYSFEDAHSVVGGITRSFTSFWESECVSMKASLVKMDVSGTGRVPLSKFYSSALDSEWRFGESEAYLRELGALDESSAWRGKQVIIPNYVQAASNCIVSTPHYLVCCVNECEELLGEVEAAVGAPAATPSEILALVGNMTSQTTLENDEPVSIDGALATQLQQIAAANDGKVPLHGRLFAQWLHFVFPRECPFPHKTGTVAAVTPSEFGESYLATGEEMERHASSANSTDTPAEMDVAELQWMSQWSPEEELVTDLSGELRAPWESGRLAVNASLMLLVCGILGFVGFGKKSSSLGSPLLPTHGKAHFV